MAERRMFRCETLPIRVLVEYEDLGIVDTDYVTKFTYDGAVVLSKWPCRGVLDNVATVARQREAHDLNVLEVMGLNSRSIEEFDF